MFKKTTKQRPRLIRKRIENDDEEDDEASHTADRIHAVKRKRQLLEDLQYKKGLNAADLLKAKRDEASTTTTDDQQQQQQHQTESILAQKHRHAMEAYIEARRSKTHEPEATKPISSNAKEALFAELKVVGSTHSSSVREHDVGSGGALVAGTGLAEVVLPFDERLQMGHQTEQAVLPKALPTTTTTLPSRFAAPQRSDTERPNELEALHRYVRGQRQTTTANRTSSSQPSTASDNDRMGFAALQRGQLRAPKQDAASDDRVYRQFVRQQHHQRKK